MHGKKPRLAPLLVLAAALLAPAAEAAAQTRLGDTELGFSIDVDDLAGGDEAQLRVGLRAGRYLNEHLEIGVELDLRGAFDDLGDDVAYRLFALYELAPGASAVWYGRAGYAGIRRSVVTLDYLEVGLGAKTYLRDDTALYAEVSYGHLLSGAGDDGVVRTTTGLVCSF